MNNKTIKDKELRFIVNAYNDECQDYLYKQLAELGEDYVWALLLVDYLNYYKESPTERRKSTVEALMALMPDDSRKKVVSYIKHNYLRKYFDKDLITKILTNDFPSRSVLDYNEKAYRSAAFNSTHKY